MPRGGSNTDEGKGGGAEHRGENRPDPWNPAGLGMPTSCGGARTTCSRTGGAEDGRDPTAAVERIVEFPDLQLIEATQTSESLLVEFGALVHAKPAPHMLDRAPVLDSRNHTALVVKSVAAVPERLLPLSSVLLLQHRL